MIRLANMPGPDDRLPDRFSEKKIIDVTSVPSYSGQVVVAPGLPGLDDRLPDRFSEKKIIDVTSVPSYSGQVVVPPPLPARQKIGKPIVMMIDQPARSKEPLKLNSPPATVAQEPVLDFVLRFSKKYWWYIAGSIFVFAILIWIQKK